MRKARRIFTLFPLLAMISCANELILPGPAMERDRPVTAVFKIGRQATGKGELRIHWTDVYGRVVDDRTIPAELTDENEIRFQLDLRRAVAMQNEIQVHFSFDGVNKKGEKDHREQDASVAFIAKPPDRDWWDYQIVMWQGGSAAHFAQLEKLGINAGKSNESTVELPDFLLKNNLRWYVENIATDFYSEYHRYRPDRPYDWSLTLAKDLYKKDMNGKEGLKRHPSFEDPQWIAKIHDRLVQSARTFSPYRPIFYNLADESGIAELASFWDFDFSDHSLDAMRTWLKNRYGTLAALNRQWETAFTTWDEVTPDTTREAMKRTDGNYSSWADQKEWMDISYANALKMGSEAVRSVEPDAYVGIEGAQMPGWGGYDYSRIAQVLQAMEPYDIGDSIEIVRSLNPRLAFVTTAFAQGPWEKHRVWYELLHGARGQIIWDEKSDFVHADGTVGERGREAAPYYKELRGGIGALLIDSVRQSGPIAIHYSQASMRTAWMLAQRPKGDAWIDRKSSTERKDSDFLRLRDSYCRLIEDEGLQYNFVAYGQVEQGELLKRGYRVLILPRSSALSELEARAIEAFVRQGGTLVVDGEAGTFDERSRQLPRSSLAGLLEGETGRGRVVRMNALDYRKDRLAGAGTELHGAMHGILEKAGVRPEFSVVDGRGQPVTGVETHEFRNGGVTILGLLSNPQLGGDELGPPGFGGNERFEKPRTVHLKAPVELYAYDIRNAKPLGRVKQLALTIDPYEPTILAFSATPIPDLRVDAPLRLARGETGRIGLALNGPVSVGTDVFHTDVFDPEGNPVSYYSGNIQAQAGVAEIVLPLAANETTGKWSVRVKELLSGQERTASFEVVQ